MKVSWDETVQLSKRTALGIRAANQKTPGKDCSRRKIVFHALDIVIVDLDELEDMQKTHHYSYKRNKKEMRNSKENRRL